MPVSPWSRWLLAAAVAAGAALTACADDDATTVTMPGVRFQPARVTVQAGDTVIWTNDSDFAHSVTALPGALPSGAAAFATGRPEPDPGTVGKGLLHNGESYSITFQRPGLYRYFCVPHSGQGMSGVVEVVE